MPLSVRPMTRGSRGGNSLTPHDRLAFRLHFAMVLAGVAIAVVIRGTAFVQVIKGRDGQWWGYVRAVGVFTPALFIVVGVAAWSRIMRIARRAEQGRDELQAPSSTSQWFWQSTPDMVAAARSPTTGQVPGYYREEIVGRSMFDFLHPDDVTAAKGISETARREGTGWHDIELRWQHCHGHVVHLQGSAAPILDADGAVIGFRGARRPVESGAARVDLIAAVAAWRPCGGPKRADGAAADRRHQPQHTWVNAEALARFPDGRGPDLWLAEAQVSGLATELDLLAMARTAAHHRRDHEHAAVRAGDDINEAPVGPRENGCDSRWTTPAPVMRHSPTCCGCDQTPSSSIARSSRTSAPTRPARIRHRRRASRARASPPRGPRPCAGGSATRSQSCPADPARAARAATDEFPPRERSTGA